MFNQLRKYGRLAVLIAALPVAASCQTPGPQAGAASSIQLFPANGATNVNPDTHLALTFPAPPAIGSSGRINIYDAADKSLVDALDLAIPASPNPTGRSPTADGSTKSPPPPEPAGPDSKDYQAVQIGGAWFHFFPIIVRGSTATIYPHNNKLQYGHTYIVKMDAATLKPPAELSATPAGPSPRRKPRQPPTPRASSSPPTARATSTPCRAPSTSFRPSPPSP